MTDLPMYSYSRDFDAPLASVWAAWTDPKLLAVWYGPGVETVIHAFDLRPGGVWLNEMKWGETSDFSRMDFLSVTPEARITWNHSSCDSSWVIAPNQMMPNWPKTLLTTVTLTAQGAKTRVLLEQTPVDASQAEIECFAQMMSGMDGGWGKGFDLMETLLDGVGQGK